jgi:hypothetical protein
MTTHPGRITINTGTYTDTCTYETDLIANQAKRPAIRDMMEYANRRALTTLLTSGVVTPYGIDNTQKTKFAEVNTKGTPVGNNAYQFPVMGRIEKPSVIIKQIGATAANGSFQLLMGDSHLFDGMNVAFYGSRFQARVDGNPQPNGAGSFIYNFMVPSGDTFVYSTHVATQPGTTTCMGMYTSYGENSKKSEGRSKFADMFVNHTTIQRSTVAITGTAASQVLWYTFTAADGSGSTKGWMYEELAQQQAQFVIQNERQKWWGVSSMKNTDGTIRQVAPTDRAGNPLVQGDGYEEQTGGGTVIEGSGTNGEWTVSDLKDAMIALEYDADKIMNLQWVLVTGTHGYYNFQEQCKQLGIEENTSIFNPVTNSGEVGGAKVHAGYHFASFNVAGNQIVCVKHPIFDDARMFPARGADGNILMSSTAYLFTMGEGTSKNLEILYKAANGLDRSNVTAKINGMTGASEVAISEEDSMKYALLKEDMLVVYDTKKSAQLVKRR